MLGLMAGFQLLAAGGTEYGGAVAQALFLSSTNTWRATAFRVVRTPIP